MRAKSNLYDLFKRLVETVGVSGFEEPVRQLIKEQVTVYGAVRTDRIGNLIQIFGDSKPEILLIAHMDELGMAVTHIEENGYVRFKHIARLDDRYLVGKTVQIHTENGIVEGVIGLKAPHLMIDPKEAQEVIPWHKLYIDVCTRSRRETESLGIKILDPITIEKSFKILNEKYVCGRSLDDRFGCLALIELSKRLSKTDLDKTVTLVWSVQEEVGLRGARVISKSYKPDYAIAVDSYASADAPNIPLHLAPARLGEGPVLRLLDRSAIASRELRKVFETVAEKYGIPLQVGATGGGTDGSVIQQSEGGVSMMAVSVPIRYLHSPVEICHIDDLMNLIELLDKSIEHIKK